MTIRQDLIIDQGASFQISVELFDINNEPIETENLTVFAQLRRHYTSNNAVTFDTTINEEENELILSLTPEQTSELPAGRYVYEVKIIFNEQEEDAVIDRILEGVVTVSPQVARL